MEGNYLKIIFLIDESGSMSGTEADVIGGFNTYVEKQLNEKAGKVTASLYKFNSRVKRVYLNKPMQEIKKLTPEDYMPGDFTALYDAVGSAIRETDASIAEMPETERPDKVIMVIITDGQENASKEFSSQAVNSLIATHEKLLNWTFIYLGSGLSDFADADSLGIKHRVSSPKMKLRSNFIDVAESSLFYRKSNKDSDEEIIDDLMSNLGSN